MPGSTWKCRYPVSSIINFAADNIKSTAWSEEEPKMKKKIREKNKSTNEK